MTLPAYLPSSVTLANPSASRFLRYTDFFLLKLTSLREAFPRKTTDAPKSRFTASDRDRSRFPSQAFRSRNFAITHSRTFFHTSSHRFSRSCSIPALPRFFRFQVTRGASDSRSLALARELKNLRAHDFSCDDHRFFFNQRFFLRLSTRVSPLTRVVINK